MAYFYTYMKKEKSAKCFFDLARTAEENREVERNSAIKIQSWFRSLKVQMHIKFLHDCAIIIQKTYRAYVGRRLYRERVHNLLSYLMKVYYDSMATKIQARWRGYFIRKYKSNYYTRKHYLDALVLKNEAIDLQLKEIDEFNKRNEETQIIEKEMASRLYNNRKTHYLLSTKVSQGIYNSPMNPHQEKEAELEAVTPLSADERRKLECKKREKYLKTVTGIPKVGDENKSNEVLLPPLKGTKPQGPFREPVDVQKQRYKELLPSLRVATDYRSVEDARSHLRQEEWTKRIIDQPFLPSPKQTYKYQPTLHTSSSYGRLDYGTKHFRDEQADEDIQIKPFQRVVSPIPFFDKLGKTY